jgi:endonuclease/exonuclease/phosphatase family metal-dependent hydrolase
VRLRAITWNLFHGRDFPPNPALLTWRSRLLRTSERDATHLQVNRSLLDEFAGLIDGAEWDVILLQECPPRFASPLARLCDADAHRVLTSRNQLRPLRTALALANPDLIASNEGGSNLTLVRLGSPLGQIVERREIVLRERRPERRTMALTRTSSGLCVANLHATGNAPVCTSAELPTAAEQAVSWAAGAPLIFGGDLNLRPAEHPAVFEELRERFGLRPPTAPGSIDHLLSHGLEIVEPPTAWPPERREVEEAGLAIRLSDHAPVEAAFALS